MSECCQGSVRCSCEDLQEALSIHTRKITKRFYLCGDEVSDVADTIGLVAPRVMLCAAHQAHTILRILAEEYEV